ncbi:MAG TPA: DUF2325 domain-containing protein [Stellaceae bacterium]|nr:DUF2325 domain-containing protein [Stellaceae bacterium]
MDAAIRPLPAFDCLEHKSAAATVLAQIDRARPALLYRQAAPGDAQPPAPRKIWEMDSSLHCSVIGTCLTSGELRALIGKFHPPLAAKPTEHVLHTIAVAAASRHSLLSKQIQKALDRRHAAARRHFDAAKSVEALRALWAEARQAGEIPGAYWAILTHPLTSDAFLREVFGDVHMLSHLVGAANRADIRRLHQLEEEKAALEAKLLRQEAQLRDGILAREAKIRELNEALSARIEQQRKDAAAAEGDSPAASAVLHGVVADLKKLLDRETRRREKAERRAEELAQSCQKTERAYAAMTEEAAALRAEIDALEMQLDASSSEADAAERLDLGGATLLYVGGRPHQIARLKAIVEVASGRFMHHDGGIEERADLLPGLVSRADIALFPVDCISHRAALMLKRLCQQAGKPYLPLRSTGVAAMLRALRTQSFGERKLAVSASSD